MGEHYYCKGSLRKTSYFRSILVSHVALWFHTRSRADEIVYTQLRNPQFNPEACSAFRAKGGPKN